MHKTQDFDQQLMYHVCYCCYLNLCQYGKCLHCANTAANGSKTYDHVWTYVCNIAMFVTLLHKLIKKKDQKIIEFEDEKGRQRI